MDSLNSEDDNHICIRCKQTISGLDNYIEHRKQSLCKLMSADDFFNCLQLQHKHKTLPINSHDNEEEDEDSTIETIGANQSYNHFNSDEDESEEEIDIYRPPNDFTGGKWKPGCGPQLMSSVNTTMNSDLSEYSSDNSQQFVTINKKKSRNTYESIKRQLKDSDSANLKETNYLLNMKSMSCLSDFIDKPNNDLHINKAKHKVIDYDISHNMDIISDNNDNNDNNRLIYDQNQPLICIICDFRANNVLDLLKHYLMGGESHPINDIICETIIKSELILMKSLSFICEVCHFYTNESNNYLWHITTSSHSLHCQSLAYQSTLFECKLCDQTFHTIENLMQHLANKQSTHVNSSGPIIVFKIKDQSKQTINKYKQTTNVFNCDLCGDSFKFKTHLKKHTISEHIRKVAFPDLIKSNFIGDNPKYCCPKCDFKTDKESTHLLHSVNHELPINSKDTNCNDNHSNELSVKRNHYKYKCPLCSNSYICRELKKHINTHIKDKPFDCVQCNKKFAKISYLKIHEKRHSGIRDQICHICSATFVSLKLLNRHKKIHDIRERSFSCDVCLASFHSKYILISHMKRHLPKHERQYKCSFEGCRYAFVQKNELSEHQRVHSNPEDKPFLCDRCPYKTKSVYTFRKHYRQHTGIKPFKCDSCDYMTSLRSNLCRHSRIHTGVKPYKCPYCSYVCNTHENVRKHILKTNKHSGLYVYPCKHCDYKTNVFNHYRKHIGDNHSDIYSETEIDSLVSNLFQMNTK